MLRSSISSSALQSVLSTSAAMSSCRFNGRGRRPWHRGYWYRPPYEEGGCGGGGDHPFVSGDSHINTVRDANFGYRQGYRGNNSVPRGKLGQDFPPRPQPPQFRPHPLPPQYYTYPEQQFRPNSQQQFHQNPQPQVRPHLQFRQHSQPQHRPDDHRSWVYASSQPPPQCERFTVLSYNILADYLARDHRSKLYFHIPPYILDWEWRKKRLFVEFGLWAPDILCLQEVDRFHDLEEELAIRGYAGIWKMRTGNAVDGCAIFWRTNRFQLRHEEHIEFNKLGLRDNVAQICVLESMNQNPSENLSLSFPSSADQSGVNQVVICNIHVLFNPKRGEMKLGQVRLLLDRAYAVSRIWNDAPVIVCGDFNSTPMSPLYKFISERKLSLSGLTRDQISGQYVSSIYAPQPYLGSGLYRPQHSIDNGMAAKNVKQGNSSKGIDSDHNPQNDIDNSSQKQMLRSNTEPCSGEFQMGHGGDSSASQTIHSIQSTLNDCGSQLNKGIPNELSSHDLDSSSDIELCQEFEDLLHGEMNISKSYLVTSVVPATHGLTEHDNLKDNVNMAPSVEDFGTSVSTIDRASGSPSLNAEMSVLENLEPSPALDTKEKVGIDISLQNTCRVNQPNSSACSSSLADVDRTMIQNLRSVEEYGNTSAVKMLPCTEENASLDIDDHKIYIDSNCEVSNQSSEEPASAGGSFGEQLDDQSVPDQGSSLINESCSSEENSDPNFFRELIGTEDSRDYTELYAENNFSPSPGNADTSANASVPTNLRNSDQVPPTATTGFPAANMEYSYNPYLWTPAEIEVASGNAGCSLIEHGLKLRSAYTDVEDCSGTKDSNREPEVTSYHRLFMGTVDYIWYSEGLQTVKVLDTIPKHVLWRTSGFPTKKWGSDHLALACQMAFTKRIETTK